MPGNKQLLPVRKGRAKKPSDASVLLHALVVALRDDEPKEKLVRLVSCYPRILNRSNPFSWLIEENARLARAAGEKPDRQLTFKIERELEEWSNHRPVVTGILRRILHPFVPKGADRRL